MNDYERSIDWAVQRELNRRMVPDDEQFEKLVGGIVILCRRIRLAVPVMQPCEVMAILDSRLTRDPGARKFNFVVRALLRNGWSVAQTMQFYENFRNANPKMYDLRLARLLTRGQLYATYGNTYGSALADILVDPKSNPLLYAMLYGNIMDPVEMVFRTAAVPITFNEQMLRTSSESFKDVPIPSLHTYQLEGHWLGYDTAQRLYHEVCGGTLASKLTITTGSNHDQEAKVEEEVRQAHRA